MSFGAWFQRLKCVKKHKITNHNYVQITVIMFLSCCFQRLTGVKSTYFQLWGENISNYVHIIVIL